MAAASGPERLAYGSCREGSKDGPTLDRVVPHQDPLEAGGLGPGCREREICSDALKQLRLRPGTHRAAPAPTCSSPTSRRWRAPAPTTSSSLPSSPGSTQTRPARPRRRTSRPPPAPSAAGPARDTRGMAGKYTLPRSCGKSRLSAGPGAAEGVCLPARFARRRRRSVSAATRPKENGARSTRRPTGVFADARQRR